MSKKLEDWLVYLEKLHPSEIELGLSRINEVGKRINISEGSSARNVFDFSCPVVTVAGTNGKGSTVATLSKLLKQAGLKVGTYSSPHLLRFNERIQYDGIPISDEALCAAFERVEQKREETTLTIFEFTVLAAFTFFQQIVSLYPKQMISRVGDGNHPKELSGKGIDVLVLEVGLGGRLDAVNTVDPTLAIITSISYDHEALLGHSLDLIATEKSGIFRPAIPIILGETAQREPILEKVQQGHNTCYREGKDFFVESSEQGINQWCLEGQRVPVPASRLPTRSVSLAFAAYQVLSTLYPKPLPALESVAGCLNAMQMRGRYFSYQLEGVDIILDVAHNPEGSEWLAKKLAQQNKKWIAVWASLADKVHDNMLPFFKDIIHTWCIADLGNIKRKASIDQLSRAVHKIGVPIIFDYSSTALAFWDAIKMVKPGEGIVVWGSFYTVAQVLAELPSTLVKEMNDNGISGVVYE